MKIKKILLTSFSVVMLALASILFIKTNNILAGSGHITSSDTGDKCGLEIISGAYNTGLADSFRGNTPAFFTHSSLNKKGELGSHIFCIEPGKENTVCGCTEYNFIPLKSYTGLTVQQKADVIRAQEFLLKKYGADKLKDPSKYYDAYFQYGQNAKWGTLAQLYVWGSVYGDNNAKSKAISKGFETTFDPNPTAKKNELHLIEMPNSRTNNDKDYKLYVIEDRNFKYGKKDINRNLSILEYKKLKILEKKNLDAEIVINGDGTNPEDRYIQVKNANKFKETDIKVGYDYTFNTDDELVDALTDDLTVVTSNCTQNYVYSKNEGLTFAVSAEGSVATKPVVPTFETNAVEKDTDSKNVLAGVVNLKDKFTINKCNTEATYRVRSKIVTTDGKEVVEDLTPSKEFTCDSETYSGFATEHKVDVSKFAGKSIVFNQYLDVKDPSDGTWVESIAKDERLDNPNETITVEKPTFKTDVAEKVTKKKEIYADGSVDLVDTINVQKCKPESQYRFRTKVYEVDDNKLVKDSEESKEFTCTSKPENIFETVTNVDVNDYANKKLVLFQYMDIKASDGTWVEVAKDDKLDNPDETITLKELDSVKLNLVKVGDEQHSIKLNGAEFVVTSTRTRENGSIDNRNYGRFVSGGIWFAMSNEMYDKYTNFRVYNKTTDKYEDDIKIEFFDLDGAKNAKILGLEDGEYEIHYNDKETNELVKGNKVYKVKQGSIFVDGIVKGAKVTFNETKAPKGYFVGKDTKTIIDTTNGDKTIENYRINKLFVLPPNTSAVRL